MLRLLTRAGREQLDLDEIVQRLQQVKAKAAPSDWRKSTLHSLNHASRLVAEGAQLRQQSVRRAEAAVQQLAQLHRQTQVTLRTKVNETASLINLLEAQVTETHNEIKRVERSEKQLRAALTAKEEPLVLCQARHSIRAQRPARERVRDEVEEILEAELRELLALVQRLQAKLADTEQLRESLEQRKQALIQDMQRKKAALQLDSKALKLEVKPARPLTRRGASTMVAMSSAVLGTTISSVGHHSRGE